MAVTQAYINNGVYANVIDANIVCVYICVCVCVLLHLSTILGACECARARL